MIEAPTSTAIIRTAPEESDEVDAPLMASDEKKPLEHELLLVKSKPLTARFRTIRKHLMARGGRLARFRGLHIFLGGQVVFHTVSAMLLRLLPHGLFFRSLTHLFVSVALCRISLLWNHVVVSEPSQQSWYSRIVSREIGAKVVIPTALFALAEQASNIVPVLLMKSFQLQHVLKNPHYYTITKMNEGQQILALVQIVLVGLSGVICFLTIYLPAQIAFARVQASLLSPEDQTIVPADLTFGGKILPAIMEGYGKRAMSEAWKTVDWNARVRLFKIYAKVFLIQIALFVVWALVMVFEWRYAIGTKRFDESIQLFVMQAKNANN